MKFDVAVLFLATLHMGLAQEGYEADSDSEGAKMLKKYTNPYLEPKVPLPITVVHPINVPPESVTKVKEASVLKSLAENSKQHSQKLIHDAYQRGVDHFQADITKTSEALDQLKLQKANAQKRLESVQADIQKFQDDAAEVTREQAEAAAAAEQTQNATLTSDAEKMYAAQRSEMQKSLSVAEKAAAAKRASEKKALGEAEKKAGDATRKAQRMESESEANSVESTSANGTNVDLDGFGDSTLSNDGEDETAASADAENAELSAAEEALRNKVRMAKVKAMIKEKEDKIKRGKGMSGKELQDHMENIAKALFPFDCSVDPCVPSPEFLKLQEDIKNQRKLQEEVNALSKEIVDQRAAFGVVLKDTKQVRLTSLAQLISL